ncbi:hypothetical protein E4N77_11420 [Treponema denticola]|nr:hypothetical protein E4N77_11420 [Treponema denticola]
MLYCIVMIGKYSNNSYRYSHQKNAKSEAKHLTRSSVPDTIFSHKKRIRTVVRFFYITPFNITALIFLRKSILFIDFLWEVSL